MRLLKRNLQEFEYYAYTGKEPISTPEGKATGENKPRYATDPVVYEGNISPAGGYVSQQWFGRNLEYTHTLLMDDPDADIDEFGRIVFKGKTFDVVKVSPSFNILSVALRQVTKNG